MAGRVRSEDLELAVMEMVKVAVGDQLSTVKEMVDGSLVDSPSVILARRTTVDGDTIPPPPYPFVMIDKAQQQKTATVINRFIDEPEAGVFDYVHRTAVVARVNIKVFGTPEYNVDDIGSDLDQAFSVQDYQRLIQDEYGDECAFTQTSDPITTSAFINNVSQEVCSFDAYFSLVREYRQKNIDTITDIESEGGLFHVGGDPLE